jgi:IclR family KDG regulon transcriptional repressor
LPCSRYGHFPRGVVKQNPKDTSIEKSLSKYVVPAVDRAIRILLMLSRSSREMTLAEIAVETGWHKSSVHKILVTLEHHGFLDRNEGTKRYTLGIELAKCGQLVLNNFDINASAKLVLRELADYSGETATFAILRGTKIVIVDVVEPLGGLRVSPPIGTIDPVTAKSNGKAVLAFLPADRVDEIIQTEGLPSKTRNSITKEKNFQNELNTVREQGYAIDVEEFQEGISAVSAPVFGSDGQVFGTLSLVGPTFRMTKEKMQRYGRKCATKAAQLTPLIR